MMRRSFAVLLACLGCAQVNAQIYGTAKTTSMQAPGEAPRSFRSVLVLASTEDFGLQVRAESSVVRAAKRLEGATLIPSHVLFFPQRQYSDAERAARLKSAGVEAVLVMADGTTDPPTYIAQAYTSGSCYGWCSSYSVAAGTERQDLFTIVSRLVDLRDLRVTWIGSTRVKRANASNNRLVDMMADDVVKALVRDGVLSESAPRN